MSEWSASDDALWDIDGSVRFCAAAKRVALQFPDELLPAAPRVAARLRAALAAAATLGTGGEGADAAASSAAPASMPVTVAVLGDTSYGSCCVDEVAAQHMSADALIHYGHACLSATSSLPVYYVFPRAPLHVPAAGDALYAELMSDASKSLMLLWECEYAHAIPDVLRYVARKCGDAGEYTPLAPAPPSERYLVPLLSPHPRLIVPSYTVGYVPSGSAGSGAGAGASACAGECACVTSVPSSTAAPPATRTLCGLRFETSRVPCDSDSAAAVTVVDIGSSEPRARFLTLQFAMSRLLRMDPNAASSPASCTPYQLTLLNSRRQAASAYMHVEAVRNANILGLVAGTLGMSRHRDLIATLRAAAKAAGKHMYVFVVGKLSAVKLGNFPEVDAFILMACPEHSLLSPTDVRDYVKPVATPHEALIALDAGVEWTGAGELDFSMLLSTSRAAVEDALRQRDMYAAGGAAPDDDPLADVDASDAPPAAEAEAEAGAEAAQQLVPHASGAGALSTAVFSSPAAEYLRSKRTWQGLAYDVSADNPTASTTIEQGQRGIASRYAGE